MRRRCEGGGPAQGGGDAQEEADRQEKAKARRLRREGEAQVTQRRRNNNEGDAPERMPRIPREPHPLGPERGTSWSVDVLGVPAVENSNANCPGSCPP